MPPKVLLVSIKPEYAALIFSGEKTVELRRTRPNIRRGDWLAIYASSPSQELRGIAEIKGVVEAPPRRLWRLTGVQSGISQHRFIDYFRGKDQGFGILLGSVQEYRFPIPLSEIRSSLRYFTPPQIYRYLDESEQSRLRIHEVHRRTLRAA